MGLVFYDENQDAFASNPLRSFFDGHSGGPYEQLVFIRNDDATRYFTNITLLYVSDTFDMDGPIGESGWSIKFLYGTRRPTESEWDSVQSGDDLILPNIGSTDASDTATYHPVWIRKFCPGGQNAQIKDGQRLRLTYLERLVGG